MVLPPICQPFAALVAELSSFYLDSQKSLMVIYKSLILRIIIIFLSFDKFLDGFYITFMEDLYFCFFKYH